jgi:hypothetical protein
VWLSDWTTLKKQSNSLKTHKRAFMLHPTTKDAEDVDKDVFYKASGNTYDQLEFHD